MYIVDDYSDGSITIYQEIVMASITNRKGKYYVVYWFDSFDGKRKQKWE